MKKSEIVIAVVSNRSTAHVPEKKILGLLSSALKNRSLLLENWDELVDFELARGIVRHISSVKGDLSFLGLIDDIDLLLKRISMNV